MTIYDPEIASQYGALDTTAVADGGAGNAAIIRTVGVQANRLGAMGGPILNLMWRVDGAATEGSGGNSGYAGSPWWTRAYWGPIFAPKKPSARQATVQVIHDFASGAVVYLQIATSRAPFSPNADLQAASNVLKMTGTGSLAEESLSSLDLGDKPLETFDFYVKAFPGAIADSTAFGTFTGDVANGKGTIEIVGRGGHTVVDTAATWASGGSSLTDSPHVLIGVDAAGNAVTAPRLIDLVVSDTELGVRPPYSTLEQTAMRTNEYEIRSIPAYRLASITIHEDDLT